MFSALALALGGCAHYTPAPLASAPPLAGAEAAAGLLPPHPLAVDEVVALALARDPDLIAARARRGVAQAQLVAAGVLPNPQLGGSLLPLLSGPGNVPAWTLGLTQDVKALLIYRPRLRAARAAAAQVDAELLWQEWQVAGQARQLAV
ncbi:MAG: TolC family protein, partial [Sphingomonadales bacterium]|nr:TolC family protein [Sphingomonadales bacterium]